MKNSFKSWISHSIKDGVIKGWLINENDFSIRDAFVVIGANRYYIQCNKKRNAPKRYQQHLYNGFALTITYSMFIELLDVPTIELYDKETETLVSRVKIEISGENFAHYCNFPLFIGNDICKIHYSKYFDRRWYRDNYLHDFTPNVVSEIHYYFIGWRSGLIPSPLFNSKEYTSCKIKGVNLENKCPLIDFDDDSLHSDVIKRIGIHHITTDINNIDLISSSAEFDSSWYCEHYNAEIKDYHITPEAHYYYIGWQKGYNPSRSFDTNYYVNKYLNGTRICPLVHYLIDGKSNGFDISAYSEMEKISYTDEYVRDDIKLLENSKFFDAKFYKRVYLGGDDERTVPEIHYYFIGWKLGYNPSCQFSTDYYLRTHKHKLDSKICPLIHFIKDGERLSQPINETYDDLKENALLIEKSDLFSSDWYKNNYMRDSLSYAFSPAEHYLVFGWWNGYNPSGKFDNNQYLDCYLDVCKLAVPPLLHYLKSGSHQDKMCIPCFYDSKCKEKTDTKIKSPFISVIVYGNNYDKFVRKTIDSILNQTYRNFELVIVDDGSSDSRQVISSYVGKNRNVHFYTSESNEKNGLTQTIKLALEKSHGDYIAFCNVGDYWNDDYLLEKVAVINKSPSANIIVNDVQLIGNSEKIINFGNELAQRKKKFSNSITSLSPLDLRDRNWIYTLSCVIVKSDKVKSCYLDDNSVDANLDWWLVRQICVSTPIHYINKKLTFWRMHKSCCFLESDFNNIIHEPFLAYGDKLLVNTYKVNCLKKYIDNDYYTKDGCVFCKNKLLKYQPGFSIVISTYSSRELIKKCIDSVLSQTYSNYELIIVDDGSTDGTSSFVEDNYVDEIRSGKIVLLPTEHKGRAFANNYGVENSRFEWILYLEINNCLSNVFLENYAVSICRHRGCRAFYSRIVSFELGRRIGRAFNYEELCTDNYINLGTYCHHKSLFTELGGLASELKTLVDWELILRYSCKNKPVFIDKALSIYNESESQHTIENNIDVYDAYNYIRKRYCSNCPVVTTIITSYNNAKYIDKAIESALSQKGYFIHEILVFDDNSTDGSEYIIDYYVQMYPNLITKVSIGKNLGISKNLQKCFSLAKGKYVAILAGDDYWLSENKIQIQLDFLTNNKDCRMVFSRSQLLSHGKFSLFDCQSHLESKLNGDDLIRYSMMNVISNISCCLFESQIVKKFPSRLFVGRFNEIAVSFFVVRYGKIGYIPSVLSVCRRDSKDSLTIKEQLQFGLECRLTALNVCAKKYKKYISTVIENEYKNKIKNLEIGE